MLGFISLRSVVMHVEEGLTLLPLPADGKVSTQVVAGVNYHLTLELKDAANKVHEVEATVWARPWLEAQNDASNPAWQLTSVSLVGSS